MGRRAIVPAFALAVAGIGAYFCWSRKADLRGFDPAARHKKAPGEAGAFELLI